MAEQGIHKIALLQRLYIRYQLAADVLFAAAPALLIGCLGYAVLSWSLWWSVLFFALFFAAINLLGKRSRVGTGKIVTYLDSSYPELEESCNLALKEPGELNLLEKMQLAKVKAALGAVPAVQKPFLRRLKLAILFFAVTPLLGWEITRLHGHLGGAEIVGPAGERVKNHPAEKLLPEIASVDLEITPPPYTRKPRRNQHTFTVEAEQGSLVTWKLHLNVAAAEAALAFNTGEKLLLRRSGRSNYYGQKGINKPGFYQVEIDGKLSELYQVQVVKDNAPVIHIDAPQQYTYIDAGEARKVSIKATVDDDYGVSNAFISATVAKGSGEAVKFKEQKIDFATAFGGTHYDLQKLVSLPSLNMEPGDELYFYIQAQDNHHQQSRTDVYIVALQDTAQLLSMDGLLTGMNVKPEYFRSERQIILDSEKLLRDGDSIHKDAFNIRSNELATDQKLLRLRYGKFLGEESESQIDPRADQNDAVSDPNNFGNSSVVLDKYTDKHDNAEDAQFFDPGVKAQLRATLDEMWKAELQLRLYKPDAARPFEYKALRLLKDLQQKSRMYVAKTAYNPSPLKMEKRLSGDLAKITQPTDHQDIKQGDKQFEALKNAAAVLEQIKGGARAGGAELHTLQLANVQLSEKAAADPELYLPALSALRHILARGRASDGDVRTVQKAIQRILPPGKALPTAFKNSADMGLSGDYFKNLDHK